MAPLASDSSTLFKLLLENLKIDPNLVDADSLSITQHHSVRNPLVNIEFRLHSVMLATQLKQLIDQAEATDRRAGD